MKKVHSIIITLITLIMVSCGGTTRKDDKSDNEEKRALISVLTVKDTLFNHYIELQGNVDTKQNIVINAEFGGALNAVFAQEGQNVKKGQLLAQIADGGLAQQLNQAITQSSLAKTTYQRQKRLWDQKIGSELEYLQAKTNYQTQATAVKQLQDQLSRTKITAPFTGTIDEIFADRGTVVSPGAPVMRIVNLDSMFIEAEVPEKYVKRLEAGVDVNVNFPILNEQLNTTIKQVSDYINPSNRSFKIMVDIPNDAENIKPNLTSRLKINDYTNPNAILIPQSIISEDAGGAQYVYIVDNANSTEEAVARKVIIKTGESQGDLVEVLGGLRNGNIVIKEGARNVKDGQKVKILNVE